MESIVNGFEIVLHLSIMATFVAVIILFTKLIFREKIGVKGNYFIWLILILRLLMPYTPQSQISFFNLFNNNYAMGKVINSSDMKMGNKNISKNTVNLETKVSVPKSTITKKNNGVNNYIEIAAFLWILVVIILALKMVIATILFSYKLSFYKEVRENDVLDMLRECKNKVGVKKRISIYRTNLVKVPGIFGIFRPKLLLPFNLEKRIDKDELKYIMFHEISHIKRKDIEINCLVSIIQAIHWFNPVLWYAFYKMGIDREIACDALAISAIGENQSSNYGMTILKTVRRFKTTKVVYGMESFANNKYEVKRRIKMISKFKKKSYKFSIVAVVVLVAVGAITLTNSKNLGLAGTKGSHKIVENKSQVKVKKSKDTNKINTTVKSSETSNETDKLESNSTKAVSENKNVVSTAPQKQTSSSNSDQEITGKVKDYILNGQNNLSSAQSLNWSKRFLDQVDIESLYKKYTAAGGNSSNVKDFAKYITLNAPAQSNWQELFKKDYQDVFNKSIQVSKYVYLGDDLYQVYIDINGKEVPHVVVSSRTGYFHG